MSLFGRSRRGGSERDEPQIRGAGEDPRPGSGKGVRISFALARIPMGPGELLPGSGKDPRPGRPRRRSEGLLLFDATAEIEDVLPSLRRREKRWAGDLPARLPQGAELHSIVRYSRSRYEIDVLAASGQIDAVVDSVRSAVGSRGSAFSFERY